MQVTPPDPAAAVAVTFADVIIDRSLFGVAVIDLLVSVADPGDALGVTLRRIPDAQVPRIPSIALKMVHV